MAKKVARPNKKPPDAESRPPTPAEIAALATCERYGNKADELLEILHDLQHQLGYIPEETLPVIGRALNRSRAEVHGVVTFYHDLKGAPAERPVIKLCRAEACQARGVEALAPLFENDARIEVETVYCLGLCASGPSAMVGARVFARLDEAAAQKLIGEVAA